MPKFRGPETFKTWEFVFYVFVSGIVIVYGIFLVEQLPVRPSWAFVMGVGAAVGLMILGDELGERARDKVGA